MHVGGGDVVVAVVEVAVEHSNGQKWFTYGSSLQFCQVTVDDDWHGLPDLKFS